MRERRGSTDRAGRDAPIVLGTEKHPRHGRRWPGRVGVTGQRGDDLGGGVDRADEAYFMR